MVVINKERNKLLALQFFIFLKTLDPKHYTTKHEAWDI